MSRETFETWFKSSFHPDKTGPYVKDQLFCAWQAATASLQAERDQLAADSKKLKRIRKALRLLDVVKRRQRWHSSCRSDLLHLRSGTDGILGGSDEHAVAYSNMDMRREFLQSIVEDRPVNWAYARYLENTDWQERCRISREAFYGNESAQLRNEVKV